MAYSLETINAAIRSDPAAFVAECEAAHEKKIRDAARRIAAHRDQSHIILLSGPSGSGRTTTAMMIDKGLGDSGIGALFVLMEK